MRSLDDAQRVWGGNPLNEATLLHHLGLGPPPTAAEQDDISGIEEDPDVPPVYMTADQFRERYAAELAQGGD